MRGRVAREPRKELQQGEHERVGKSVADRVAACGCKHHEQGARLLGGGSAGFTAGDGVVGCVEVGGG